MRVVAVAVVLFCLACGVGAALGAERPIVAVFDAQAKGVRFQRGTLDRLGDYLATLLTTRGYQVVPRAQLKSRLTQQKKAALKQCYDQSCQIQVGRELAAQKSMSVDVIRLGKRCVITLTLYDLARAASEHAAAAEGGCGEDDIVDTLKKAVAALKAPAAGPAGSYDSLREKMARQEKYKTDLTRAWETVHRYAALPKEAPAAQIGALKKFLADFPKDNPHAAAAQQEIARLEAQVGQARSRAEQEKAWLETVALLDDARRADEDKLKALLAYAQKYPQDAARAAEIERRRQAIRQRVSAARESAECKAASGRAFNPTTPKAKRIALLAFLVKNCAIETVQRNRAEQLRLDLNHDIQPNEVRDPKSLYAWLRCPLGQNWVGETCRGKARELSFAEAKSACPAGYRLPGHDAMVSLLARCERSVLDGKEGYCKSCKDSPTCRAMFGADHGRYWAGESAYSGSKAWAVGYGSGDMLFMPRQSARQVRCVRPLSPL